MIEGSFDPIRELELEAYRKKLAAIADANPIDCVILLIDRRAGRSGYLVAMISPASAWHPLLPQRQIAEIRDREPADRI